MTIYLVCHIVDLGYHVEYAYTTLEKAEAKMTELVSLSKETYIKSVMTPSRYRVASTYEQAVEDAELYHEKWEIYTVEILE